MTKEWGKRLCIIAKSVVIHTTRQSREDTTIARQCNFCHSRTAPKFLRVRLLKTRFDVQSGVRGQHANPHEDNERLRPQMSE